MALYDDTPSDGVFRFYWADHEEFEFAHGPFDSVEQAKAHALDMAQETTYGPEPGVTIYVARADKRTCVPPAFDTEALMAEYKATGTIVFDAEAVLDLFMDANEDCWGDDGWDGLSGDYVKAEAELLRLLNVAVADWIKFHLCDDAVVVEEDLQRLLQGAMRIWEYHHRAQIKTWMFGKLENAVTFVIPEMTPADLQERNIRSLMRITGLPRAQVEAAQRGDRESITAYLTAARTPTTE